MPGEGGGIQCLFLVALLCEFKKFEFLKGWEGLL